MKINLRRASVLQDTLKAEIAALSSLKGTLGTININIFDQDIENKIKAGQERIEEDLSKLRRYSEARGFLRATVARLNVETGVSDLLVEEATLESREQGIAEVCRCQPRLSASSLQRQLDRMTESPSYSSYSLDIRILSEEKIAALRGELADLKRRRRQLRDRMVDINARTTFHVPAEVAAVLVEVSEVDAAGDEGRAEG